MWLRKWHFVARKIKLHCRGQRTVQERLHPLIDTMEDRRYLAVGDTGHAHRLHQVES